jgi:DNA-binding IclR family transcriptional regulator
MKSPGGDAMTNSKTSIVKSATRALDIIEFIVGCSKPPTFSVIQKYLEIPKSSLSYLLQDMSNHKYIQFDLDLKVYYPGSKLIQISAACMNNTNLTREIWLGIKQLSDELGETTQAGLLDGRFLVYIAKQQGTKDISITTAGYKIPAHATALGKMMLSSLSEDELKARLGNSELERYTEKTIVSYEELLPELKQIAKQGYATDNQEIILGGFCIAAPIYNNSNNMVAAMSVTVPASRINEELLKELIHKLKSTADNVSARLGNL